MVLDASKVEDKTLIMINNQGIKKVLVAAPNWIGDAVLALPAIARVRELFPASRITISGLPHICELFRESPYVNDMRIYSGSLLSTVSDIKKCGFDLAILLPNSFRTALMVNLARIPLRCGYNRDGRGIMLNMAIKVDARIKKLPQTEYYMNVVNYIIHELSDNGENPHPHLNPLPEGEETPLPFKGRERVGMGFSVEPKRQHWLHLSQGELQHANEILHNFNIPSGSLIIGINPGAAYGSAKRWHPERFALLCRTLVNTHNAKVIVFGSQQEMNIAAEIVNLSQVPVISMAGKTSIRELMSLIKQCSIFVTNDSGPMHIAAALNIPITAIFGSTDPEKTGPMGNNHVVIKKDVDCSPCFKRKCPTDLKCMDLITVDDVLKGVERIIEKR